MQYAFTITLLLALSIPLGAEQPSMHSDANPAAQAEIKALELKLAELIVRNDWDEYAKYLASDYLHTRENGHVEGKDEALAALRDVQRKIIFVEMEPADAAIHAYGDTVICNAEFIFTIRDSGQVKTRHTRVTEVFVKREGQWYLAAEQGTTIGK